MGSKEIIIDLACTCFEKDIKKNVETPPITGSYSRQVTYIVINDVAYMDRRKIKKEYKHCCCKQILVTRKSFREALENYLERRRTFQVFCGTSMYKEILGKKYDMYRMNMFFRVDATRNFGKIEMIEYDSNNCTRISAFYDDNTPYAKLIKRANDERKLLCVARYVVGHEPVCKWKRRNIYDISKIVSLDIILPTEYFAEYAEEYEKQIKGRSNV